MSETMSEQCIKLGLLEVHVCFFFQNQCISKNLPGINHGLPENPIFCPLMFAKMCFKTCVRWLSSLSFTGM